MRAAAVKLVALFALGAVLGGASIELLLRSDLVAGPPSPDAIGGDDSARPGGIDAPRPAGRDGAQASAAPRQAEIQPPDRQSPSSPSSADAIVRAAATSPGDAMNRALAVQPHWLRRDTTLRVAAVWAERAPGEALAFVEAARELDPAVKSAVRSRVLEVWAAADPGRALDYLLGRDGQDLFFFDEHTGRQFARTLAARQPHELLYAANALPRGLLRYELRASAIASLVEQDLSLALREAALAAPGSDRHQWVTAVLRAHPDRAEELGLCELGPDIDADC